MINIEGMLLGGDLADCDRALEHSFWPCRHDAVTLEGVEPYAPGAASLMSLILWSECPIPDIRGGVKCCIWPRNWKNAAVRLIVKWEDEFFLYPVR